MAAAASTALAGVSGRCQLRRIEAQRPVRAPPGTAQLLGLRPAPRRRQVAVAVRAAAQGMSVEAFNQLVSSSPAVLVDFYTTWQVCITWRLRLPGCLRRAAATPVVPSVPVLLACRCGPCKVLDKNMKARQGTRASGREKLQQATPVWPRPLTRPPPICPADRRRRCRRPSCRRGGSGCGLRRSTRRKTRMWRAPLACTSCPRSFCSGAPRRGGRAPCCPGGKGLRAAERRPTFQLPLLHSGDGEGAPTLLRPRQQPRAHLCTCALGLPPDPAAFAACRPARAGTARQWTGTRGCCRGRT